MNKNIFLGLGVLFGIGVLACGIFFLFPAEEGEKQNTSKHTKVVLVENCNTYTDFTKEMSEEQQKEMLNTLKKTKNTDDLLPYVCSQNIAWRAYIAENIYTPEKILNIYLDDPSYIVRQYLAANRKIPDSIAQKLQNDDERVLFALARNPVVSNEILEFIANENFSDNIQESLAYNRGTTEEFQKKLAEKITSPNALKQLKNNPNISGKVLEIIKKREDK